MDPPSGGSKGLEFAAKPGYGRGMFYLRGLIGALAVSLWSLPAVAHPHVWIETTTSFVVAEGTITALRIEWKFDEFFSTSLFDEFDLNHNRRFEPAEITALEQGAFNNTAQQNYFTFIKVGGKKVATQKASEFTARVEGKAVVYSFLLPLAKPVDPRQNVLTVTTYEDTYYIDVAPAPRHAVAFEGDNSLSCKGTVAEDPKTKIYFGSVNPLMITVHC